MDIYSTVPMQLVRFVLCYNYSPITAFIVLAVADA